MTTLERKILRRSGVGRDKYTNVGEKILIHKKKRRDRNKKIWSILPKWHFVPTIRFFRILHIDGKKTQKKKQQIIYKILVPAFCLHISKLEPFIKSEAETISFFYQPSLSIHLYYILGKGSSSIIILKFINLYREDDILKAFKTILYKFSYSMASKICHAVSAQWIGHSATISRWNDSWLHIGFNKFLEKFCVDDVCIISLFVYCFKRRRKRKTVYFTYSYFFQIFPNWKISTEQNIINSFLGLLKTEERGDFNPIVPVGSGFTFDKNLANDETISKGSYGTQMVCIITSATDTLNEVPTSKCQLKLDRLILVYLFQ